MLAALRANTPDARIEIEVIAGAFHAIPADRATAILLESARSWLEAQDATGGGGQD